MTKINFDIFLYNELNFNPSEYIKSLEVRKILGELEKQLNNTMCNCYNKKLGR